MIVTIDGPAGSGKSTVARAIAAREGLTYLDTGAMYRANAWACLDRGIAPDDEAGAASVAEACTIEFVPEGESQRVIFDGVDVTEAIRTPEVEAVVSVNSAIPAVRDAMGKRQKAIAAGTDIVCEGRDMGTVVFPDAEVKVFLTASPEARARRRAVQRAGGDTAKDATATADESSVQEILESIKKRDEYDSSRETAPLKPADDAVMIDSSDLSLDEVCDKISALIAKAREASERKHEQGDAVPLAEAAVESDGAEGDKPAKADVVAKADKPAKKDKVLEPMKIVGNSYEDYYAHPMADYPLHAKATLGLLVGLVGGLSKLFFPWRLEGADELAEATRDRGAVIVMNHTSMLDPVLPVVSLYMRGCHVRPIYKSEFDKIWILKWAFARIGAIPIKRGSADMKAMRWATAALKAGESILIYPEGTRVKDDSESEIHGGFALIAQRADAPVVPIAIVGARDITPRGKHIPRPGRVFARIGEALHLSDIEGSRKERVAKLEKLVMERVFQIRDALRREHPGKM